MLDPFSVCTPIGASMLAKRVYRKCPVSLSHRVSLVNLVKLDMLKFYIILGKEWLNECYASIDYITCNQVSVSKWECLGAERGKLYA